jgi:hypothetical protein
MFGKAADTHILCAFYFYFFLHANKNKKKVKKGSQSYYYYHYYFDPKIYLGMIVLVDVLGSEMTLPYEPDMTVGEYMRNVVAQALTLKVGERNTVPVHLQSYDDVAMKRLIVITDKQCAFKMSAVIPDGTTFVYTTNKKADVEGNAGDAELPVDCSICLEKTTSASFAYTLVCGHTFCGECLEKAFKENARRRVTDTCPNCRSVPSELEKNAFNTHMKMKKKEKNIKDFF